MHPCSSRHAHTPTQEQQQHDVGDRQLYVVACKDIMQAGLLGLQETSNQIDTVSKQDASDDGMTWQAMPIYNCERLDVNKER